MWGAHISRRAAAFSLMEVLIALGIFAVGLVAVAALFPTAITIQSETVRDLAGQRIAVDAKTTIQALANSYNNTHTNSTPWESAYTTLTYHHDQDPNNRAGTLDVFTKSDVPSTGKTGVAGGVQPMIDQPLPLKSVRRSGVGRYKDPIDTFIRLNAVRSFHYLLSEEIRSYPKTIPNTEERDYYWVPFIQPKDLTSATPTWVVYLMIMQRHGTERIPEARAVRVNNISGKTITFDSSGAANDYEWLDNDEDDDGLPDYIQPGDWVLADDGSIFRVVLAQKDSITIDSVVPPSGNINLLYYAVALEGGTNWNTPIAKPEARSPIVRIEQFELVVRPPGG